MVYRGSAGSNGQESGGYSSLYEKARKEYRLERKLNKLDHTNKVPSRKIKDFPKSGNEGLYGFVFLPDDGRIHRRSDLVGTLKGLETDIHENIHTRWERETRSITEELMKVVRARRGEDDYDRGGVSYSSDRLEDMLRYV